MAPSDRIPDAGDERLVCSSAKPPHIISKLASTRNSTGDAALQIQNASSGLAVDRPLAGVNGFDMASVDLGACVVVVRHHGQAVFLVVDAAIGVEQVGLVVIDQVLDALIVVQLPGLRNVCPSKSGVLRADHIVFGILVIEIGISWIDAVVGAPSSTPGQVAK